jgi:hypothetical protein
LLASSPRRLVALTGAWQKLGSDSPPHGSDRHVISDFSGSMEKLLEPV